MKRLKINDTWVLFPYVPYSSQETFMKKVLESLNNGQNALLESPTGTGKTLCLLCSSLAWLDLEKRYKEIPDLRLISKSDPELDIKISHEKLNDTDSKSFKKYRIYFCTRTHSQIKQAVKEFKTTGYQHLRSTVLASRSHLCIHPSAKKAGENLDNKCRILRKETTCTARDPEVVPDIEELPNKCQKCKSDHTCPFYLNFEQMKSERADVLFTMAGAYDQKSLLEKCKKYEVCPFYVSRHLKESADVIFLPYSYIFNPNILRGLNLNVKNAVVIIDEGHNLEQVCEDNASFTMTVSDVKNCQNELETVIKKLNEPMDPEEEEEELPDVISEPVLNELKGIMIELQRNLESLEAGEAKNGHFCVSLFSDAGFTKSEWERLIYNLMKVAQYCGEKELRTAGMRKIQNVVSRVFFLDSEDIDESQESTLEKSFKLFKQKLSRKEKEKNTEPLISFWCFDASVIMKSLQRQGVHSFIVTSGTLSPLQPLRKSLGITFEIELKNEHVIHESQVLAMSIGSAILSNNQPIIDGPREIELKCTFHNRLINGDNLYKAFGELVLRVARFSPKGLLIFFPSKMAMGECLDVWRETKYGFSNLNDAIKNIKSIHLEPLEASEMPTLQKSFQQDIENVDRKGACLLGVLRGKVSEGVDFKDDLGRTVIIFGIPYLNKVHDQRVKHKMKHIKSHAGQRAKDIWYQAQAIRPVNQALGRIIRHREDYGVVLLADVRYRQNKINQNLPVWLNRSVVNFSQTHSRLINFFSNISSKMIDMKRCIEQEQEEIQDKHMKELEKEEYPSENYHTLASMIAAEKEKEKTLCSEIIDLQRKVEEAVAKTKELRVDIAMVQDQLNVENCAPALDYNSDCESTGDGEWLAIDWE